MKRITVSALVAAGLLAASLAASAQTTSVPATQPGVAGQASTMTPAGVPNPPQRPDNSQPNSRDGVRMGAVWNNHNQANTNTPGGEASTTLNSQPNATPRVGERTRAEVRQETLHQPRPFGYTGERPAVATNPIDSTGTPK